MNAPAPHDILEQHLIDPEICIRCNTCEETCPVDAITHDSRNYVVDAAICNACGACVPPCPTGAIDNWRRVVKIEAYSVTEQLTWDVLPEQQPLPDVVAAETSVEPGIKAAPAPLGLCSTIPPTTADVPLVNLFAQKAPLTATVVGNFRVTDIAAESDTHHIVLDFGSMPFPVLEGQSIGILPPGVDAAGRPHFARQFSIASPRDGERPGYNNLALTVKRVTVDHDGKPVRGAGSHYLCDLKKGDPVQVIGPFGAIFLMPNDPSAHLIMICTGTGSAPMRAMTERRRRLLGHSVGDGGDGRLMLFFGARTQAELPYFGPLTSLPRNFIDTNLAFSRTPGQPKRYVQDLMRDRGSDVARLLAIEKTHVYVCGLKGMEEGVSLALSDISRQYGLDWSTLHPRMCEQGRYHVETY